jgi:quinol monooxygenase YgiN
MYGTVARMRVKKGFEARFSEVMKEYEGVEIPGAVASYVYRLDHAPDVYYYLCAIFESKESYRANAASPEQDARYRKLAALLDGEPEWNDGEIIFAMTPDVVPLRA